jgi:hypothetical protein
MPQHCARFHYFLYGAHGSLCEGAVQTRGAISFGRSHDADDRCTRCLTLIREMYAAMGSGRNAPTIPHM